MLTPTHCDRSRRAQPGGPLGGAIRERIEPRSEHDSATEAERAARDGTAGQAGLLLLVRDRYARVHVAGTVGL